MGELGALGDLAVDEEVLLRVEVDDLEAAGLGEPDLGLPLSRPPVIQADLDAQRLEVADAGIAPPPGSSMFGNARTAPSAR